jgi:hypothetical protein
MEILFKEGHPETIILEYHESTKSYIELENVVMYGTVSDSHGKLIFVNILKDNEIKTKIYGTYGLFYIGPKGENIVTSSGLPKPVYMTTEEAARKQIEDMQTFERVQREMSANNPYGGFAPQPNTKTVHV